MRLVFGLAFAIRFVFLLLEQPWDPAVERDVILPYDGGGYHLLATELLDRGVFGLTNPDRNQYVGITREFKAQFDALGDDYRLDLGAIRTPGYPAFVALIYAVTGPHPWIVLLLQIVIDSLTAALLASLIAGWLGTGPGISAGVLYALHPFAVRWSAMLYGETLLLLLLVLALNRLTKVMRSPMDAVRARDLILAGFLFGAGALVKPVVQYAVLVPMLVLLFRAGVPFRRRVIHALLLVAGFAVIIGPWLGRNYIRHGEVALSASGPFNLMVLYIAPMEMQRHRLAFETVEERLYLEADSLIVAEGGFVRACSGFQKARYWERVAWRHLAEDPLRSTKFFVTGFIRSIVTFESSGIAKTFRLAQSRVDLRQYDLPTDALRDFVRRKSGAELAIAVVVGALMFVWYLTSVIGFISLRRHHPLELLWICGGIVVYIHLVTAMPGQPRFVLPGIPFLMPFAGFGAWNILQMLRGTTKKADGNADHALDR